MKFLCIGDSCTDRFIYGVCERICPEAPVPVFNPRFTKENGGMASNVQSNVIALGVDCDIITNTNEILKTRYVDVKTNQMLMRVDENDRAEDTFDYRGINYGDYDAVLISSYGKGFLEDNVARNVCAHHNNVFWDSKGVIKYDLPANLKFLKINEYELGINRGMEMNLYPSNWGAHYNRADQIIVTYGYKGCKYMNKMYPPPKKVVAQDVSGAGDTFMAALAVSVTRGDDTDTSLNYANECACTVVAKRGVRTI